MHFYAEHNRYGLHTTTTMRRHDREIVISAGDLYRFPTRAARDAFVAEERNREPLTANEARRTHATGDLKTAVWEDANFMWPAMDVAGYEIFLDRSLW